MVSELIRQTAEQSWRRRAEYLEPILRRYADTGFDVAVFEDEGLVPANIAAAESIKWRWTIQVAVIPAGTLPPPRDGRRCTVYKTSEYRRRMATMTGEWDADGREVACA